MVCKFRVYISTSVFPTGFPPLPPGPFSLVTTALYLYAHIYSFRRNFLDHIQVHFPAETRGPCRPRGREAATACLPANLELLPSHPWLKKFPWKGHGLSCHELAFPLIYGWLVAIMYAFPNFLWKIWNRSTINLLFWSEYIAIYTKCMCV